MRRAAAVVAVASALWAARLAFVGGVTSDIAGLTIRSNDPIRPVEVTVVAIVVYMLTGGSPTLLSAWRRGKRLLGALPVADRFVSSRGAALVLAAAVFTTGATYVTTVAGGSDASGYVSQADRWLTGTLKPPQPWVASVPWPDAAWSFTPLGYAPIQTVPPFAQAPTYSPGLPLMMAGAKALGGQAAMFLVVPLCGAVLVVATFGAGLRISGPTVGLIAAWMVATSPIVFFMLALPYSDVPAGAAWIAAFFFLLGEGIWPVVLSGLCSGLAILIRPNIIFLAPILALWFLIRPIPGGQGSFARRVRDGLLYAVSVAPAVLFLMLLYRYLYGSPFVSGYSGVSDMFSRAHVLPNIRRYFSWAMDVQATFTIVGLAGLVLPWIWSSGRARRAMAIGALVVASLAAEYFAFLVFSDWTPLRLFIPAWPFLALGFAGVAAWLLDRRLQVIRLAAAAAVVILGVVGIKRADQKYAFDLWYGNRRYVAGAIIVRDLSPANSAVFSMEHSGSLRYYSGRMPVRYDMFEADTIDRSLQWLADHGVHSYAVLDHYEVGEFRKRFAHAKVLDAIKVPVVVYHAYNDSGTVYVFDLTTPPPADVPTKVIDEADPGRWRNWAPGPTPTLVFRGGGS
jgi:hypothetical protein